MLGAPARSRSRYRWWRSMRLCLSSRRPRRHSRRPRARRRRAHRRTSRHRSIPRGNYHHSNCRCNPHALPSSLCCSPPRSRRRQNRAPAERCPPDRRHTCSPYPNSTSSHSRPRRDAARPPPKRASEQGRPSPRPGSVVRCPSPPEQRPKGQRGTWRTLGRNNAPTPWHEQGSTTSLYLISSSP